jgi:hypothetical protein
MSGNQIAQQKLEAWLQIRRPLALGLVRWGAAVIVSFSFTAHADAKDDRLSFDIPAQPLAFALDAYATGTGIETFYDSESARGRRSTAVKGVLAADVALRILLEGTGLTEVSTGNAFAVVAAPSKVRYGGARLTEFGSYYSVLQAGVARAFCRHAETVPGDFRAIIRFSVGASGELQDLRLLNSTGDLRRDAIIADELRGVSFDAPPPRLPQPVTMMVAPRPAERTGDCDVASGRQTARVRAVRP